MQMITWLFQNVLYLAVTASVLILMILALKKIFSRSLSPKWHYYIWMLVLIRLLMPIHPQSPLSIYNALYWTSEKISPTITESVGRMQPVSQPAIGQHDTGSISPVNGDGNGDETPVAESAGTKEDAISSDQKDLYGSIVSTGAYIWLGGMAILTLYTAYINIAFAAYVRRRYHPVRDERLERILSGCRADLGINRAIPVLTTKKERTPSLYGLLRPRILVSQTHFQQLSDEEIRYIFLHELSHYKRGDIAVNWLLTLLQIVYFFNPLVWYAFYKIHEDCELSCDAAVLTRLKEDEYRLYGQTIIKLIRLFSESNFIPITAGMVKNKSSYKRRIIMISKFKKKHWLGTLLAVGIITVSALVGLTSCADKAGAEPSVDISTPPSSSASTDTSSTPDNQTAQPSPDVSDDASSPTESPSDTDSSANGYFGQWTVEKILAYGQAGTYSSEDAEKLVGQALSFSDTEAVIINDQPAASPVTLNAPEYEEGTLSASDFTANFNMTFAQLDISADTVTEVVVSGADAIGGCSLLLKDSDTMILIAGGTYFELSRS